MSGGSDAAFDASDADGGGARHETHAGATWQQLVHMYQLHALHSVTYSPFRTLRLQVSHVPPRAVPGLRSWPLGHCPIAPPFAINSRERGVLPTALPARWKESAWLCVKSARSTQASPGGSGGNSSILCEMMRAPPPSVAPPAVRGDGSVTTRA